MSNTIRRSLFEAILLTDLVAGVIEIERDLVTAVELASPDLQRCAGHWEQRHSLGRDLRHGDRWQ
ncbi:MAG: hypothetical protein U0V87_06955 [Acidobacteriota bacterium]